MNKPVIAITMGDPAGVGPELSLKAATSLRVKRVARPLIIGDNGVLTRVAKKLKIKMPPQSSIISLSHLKATEFKAAHPSVKSSRAAISYIEEAVRLAQSGAADGIVTSPINKDALRHAGFKYPGHTEFLAHLTKTKDFVMMLGGDSLKVTLVTIHEPIKKVPELLTKESILKVIKITDASFKKFYKIKKPRIAVCGLNPHAGEPHGGKPHGGKPHGGKPHGGKSRHNKRTEEERFIAPAIKVANKLGINASGPYPPDTLFYQAVTNKDFDCVVCMYHDQGLIPLKLLHFEDGVNTTLGLPIIRTSPDHGTAYDIAWKGKASAKSMIAAIKEAASMTGAGRKHNG